jgi:hypothetical protein
LTGDVGHCLTSIILAGRVASPERLPSSAVAADCLLPEYAS